MWAFGGKRLNEMKVELTKGPRRGQKIELPKEDAEKLIKKGMAKSLEKAPAKKKTTKKED